MLVVLAIGYYASLTAQTTVTFNYTGNYQDWVVPPCVTSISVDVRGADGGNANTAQGGNGARVTHPAIPVTPGQTLRIYVGGSGTMPTGGWNGGGNGYAGVGGSTGSAGGGGASDIRVAPYALANRLIVAGGGGGASGGNPSNAAGGAGGCANGVNGAGSPYTGTGGVGGSQVAGGNGGPPWGGGQWGFPGSLGQGGNGGYYAYASGGGGGGGYYGGGGGGSDNCCQWANGGGAGGGGSSFTPAGGVCTANFNNGAGQVSITYIGIPPALAASNTGPYCEGDQIDLSITAGGTQYDWAGPNGYVANNIQNPSIVGATTAMAGTYTVTITAGAGCTTTATTTVVVNTNPIPSASNTGPYCAGDVIQLNSPTGSATDDWAGPAWAMNDVQNPTIAASTPAMSGTYTVTVTNAQNCSATATTDVLVNPLPTPTATNTGPYCEGDLVQVNSTGGVDYDWTGPAGFNLPNTQNANIPNANMAMNGTYTVTVTDVNNCVSTSTTTMVVNLLPIPVANNDGPYCEGDMISMTSGGGASYAWSGPLGYASVVQNPVIMASTVPMSGTYTVVVTSAQNCSATTTTDVTVTALPIPTASNTGPYCERDTVKLNSTGGTQYAWVGPNTFISTLQNPTIMNSAPAATGTYTVTVTDGAGCVSTTTTSVLVVPSPTAIGLFNPQNPSTLKPEVYFFDESYANITNWLWNVDGATYTTPDFTHTFTNAGQYVVTLLVTNNYGCLDSTSFVITVDPEIGIYIPNSFTPNGDELNEVFYVYGSEWNRMELIIFDRWGNEVFYSTDPTKGWNGRRNNTGDVLMMGTYAYKVYIIDNFGKEHNLMGHINLLR